MMTSTININAVEYSSFNLVISHSETQRQYSNEVLLTQLSSLSVYRTEKLSSNLNGSLIIGVQEQTQNKNAIVAARNASGYFAGLSLNYSALKTINYRLRVFGQYQYHQLDGTDMNQKVRITWHDLTLGIGNYYNLSNRLQLLADISFFQELGNQRVFEPLSETITFRNKSNTSYGFGIAYYVNTRGYIAIKKIAGSFQGFQLYFAKEF